MAESSVCALYDQFDIKKNKLIWLGSLEDLKALVVNEIEEDITIRSNWKSPGGGTWCFESETLSVTWHNNSKTISFKGIVADQLLDRIYQKLNATKSESVVIIESPSDLSYDGAMEDVNHEAIAAESPKHNECIECNKLTLQMIEVQLELAMLWALFHKIDAETSKGREDENQHKLGNKSKPSLDEGTIMPSKHIDSQIVDSSNSNQEVQKKNSQTQFVNQLKNYRLVNKEKFGRQNRQRSEVKINNTNNSEHDLIIKLKEAEEEQKSLRTTIEILRQDLNQVSENKVPKRESLWQVNKSKSTKKSTTKSTKKSTKNTKKNPALHVDPSNRRNSFNEQSAPVSTTNQYSSLEDQSNSNDNIIDLGEVNHVNYHTEPTIARNSCPTRSQNNSKQFITILGDSMVKYIRQDLLSKSTNSRVCVKSFSGATLSDMEDYIKPVLRKKPDHIILHAGTNDLSTKRPSEIIKSIKNPHKVISEISPSTNVSLSSLVIRTDKSADKIDEVNVLINKYCTDANLMFLTHNQIDKRGLNSSGLHLNKVGNSILAKNFITHIKHF